MERYLNLDGDSGVTYYQIADTSITVWFNRNGKSYTYSYYKAGKIHVENMKRLAESGSGLNAYINRNVKYSYD